METKTRPGRPYPPTLSPNLLLVLSSIYKPMGFYLDVNFKYKPIGLYSDGLQYSSYQYIYFMNSGTRGHMEICNKMSTQ